MKKLFLGVTVAALVVAGSTFDCQAKKTVNQARLVGRLENIVVKAEAEVKQAQNVLNRVTKNMVNAQDKVIKFTGEKLQAENRLAKAQDMVTKFAAEKLQAESRLADAVLALQNSQAVVAAEKAVVPVVTETGTIIGGVAATELQQTEQNKQNRGQLIADCIKKDCKNLKGANRSTCVNKCNNKVLAVEPKTVEIIVAAESATPKAEEVVIKEVAVVVDPVTDTGKAVNVEGKPEEAGKPVDAGKPGEVVQQGDAGNTGRSDDAGKPSDTGKPDDAGKPNDAGDKKEAPLA